MSDLPDRDELQRTLEELASANNVPGASVAIRRGTDFVEAATGVLNVRTGVEATTDSLFQIGSITKVYTATLVMQLVGEGKVQLDEPIESYLGGARYGADPSARAITLRHLLSHTGGVHGDHLEDFGRGDSVIERFMEAAHKLPQVLPVGAMMSYCNSGFAALGRLVEVVTGLRYGDALGQRLLAPLGCDHSVSLPEDALLFRTAVGHFSDRENEGRFTVTPKWLLQGGMEPAGSHLTCTARDVTTFAQMHLDGGKAGDGTVVLAEDSAKQMQVEQAALPARNALGAKGIGLGWMISEWGGTRVIGHSGDTLGQHAVLRVFPEAGVSIALLTNGPGSSGLFRALAHEVLLPLVGAEPPALPVPLEDLAGIDTGRFVGTFEQPHALIVVRETDDGLAMDITPRGPAADLPGNNPQTGLALKVCDDSTLMVDLGAPSTIAFFGAQSDGRFQYAHLGARVVVRTA